jgi:hypothetical protein
MALCRRSRSSVPQIKMWCHFFFLFLFPFPLLLFFFFFFFSLYLKRAIKLVRSSSLLVQLSISLSLSPSLSPSLSFTLPFFFLSPQCCGDSVLANPQWSRDKDGFVCVFDICYAGMEGSAVTIICPFHSAVTKVSDFPANSTDLSPGKSSGGARVLRRSSAGQSSGGAGVLRRVRMPKTASSPPIWSEVLRGERGNPIGSS